MDLNPSRLELLKNSAQRRLIDGRGVSLSVDGSLLADIQEITGGIVLDAAINTTRNTKFVAKIVQVLGPLETTCYFGEFRTDCDCGADSMMNAKQRVGCIEVNDVPETVISTLL